MSVVHHSQNDRCNYGNDLELKSRSKSEYRTEELPEEDEWRTPRAEFSASNGAIPSCAVEIYSGLRGLSPQGTRADISGHFRLCRRTAGDHRAIVAWIRGRKSPPSSTATNERSD